MHFIEIANVDDDYDKLSDHFYLKINYSFEWFFFLIIAPAAM